MEEKKEILDRLVKEAELTGIAKVSSDFIAIMLEWIDKGLLKPEEVEKADKIFDEAVKRAKERIAKEVI